jgi:hypothetical protein
MRQVQENREPTLKSQLVVDTVRMAVGFIIIVVIPKVLGWWRGRIPWFIWGIFVLMGLNTFFKMRKFFAERGDSKNPKDSSCEGNPNHIFIHSRNKQQRNRARPCPRYLLTRLRHWRRHGGPSRAGPTRSNHGNTEQKE